MVVFPTITSRNQTIEKVVNGKTYVYERIPYYNPKIRNTSYHYRYVGRKDDGRVRKISVNAGQEQEGSFRSQVTHVTDRRA